MIKYVQVSQTWNAQGSRWAAICRREGYDHLVDCHTKTRAAARTNRNHVMNHLWITDGSPL
jgi:hypothetical protein